MTLTRQGAPRSLPLLTLDPELGALLGRRRHEQARGALIVPTHELAVGEWHAARLSHAYPGHVGLLVIDGVLARETLFENVVSMELLGSGDLVRPWHVDEVVHLLRYRMRWNVLVASRVAILDRRFAAELGRFPEIAVVLLDRADQRAERLAAAKAILQLTGVDRRVLAFLWHLAERWGRVTADGVSVPLAFSHGMLGRLVGARRPTVSTAVNRLIRRGEIVRRADGTWLLVGEPTGVPSAGAARLAPLRRPFMPLSVRRGSA